MEYDRSSLNPFCFSEKFFASCLNSAVEKARDVKNTQETGINVCPLRHQLH